MAATPARQWDNLAEDKWQLVACKPELIVSRHVGDGNVHSILLFTNDDELHRIEEGVHEMVHRAIRLDGTCSGEHGVGLGKIEYLEEELGVGTVGLMETVKRTREFSTARPYCNLPSAAHKLVHDMLLRREDGLTHPPS